MTYSLQVILFEIRVDGKSLGQIFGIYLHWGAYSVVERGEWYARKLYEEGGDDYAYHLTKYGHPSEFGYKDFIPLWKAEKFGSRRQVPVILLIGY